MTMLHYMHSWLDGKNGLELIRAENADWSFPEESCPEEFIKSAKPSRNSECIGYFPGRLDCAAIEDLKGWEGWVCKDWWCSFDSESKNFHIVPCACMAPGLRAELRGKLGGKGNGRQPWTALHLWREEKYNDDSDFNYLVSFNRLVCNEGCEVENHLGKAQFMRYGRLNINKLPTCGLKMMYPKTAGDRDCEYDDRSGHCTFNAPYTIGSVDADALGEALFDFKEILKGSPSLRKTSETIKEMLLERWQSASVDSMGDEKVVAL